MNTTFKHYDFGRLKDLALAMVFLTRVPWPWPLDAGRPIGRAAWGFPVIGIAIGLLAALVWVLADHLGLPSWVAAILAVASLVAVSGALHEDGLADCADGLGSGKRGEAAIAIMRDSRLGTHGVVALVLFLLLRVAALSAWPVTIEAILGLAAVHAGSRALMLLPALLTPPAAVSGLAVASDFRRNEIQTALVLAAFIAIAALPLAGFLLWAIIAVAAVFLLTHLAKRQIGGYTGDVMGASQQVTEMIGFVVLSGFLNAG